MSPGLSAGDLPALSPAAAPPARKAAARAPSMIGDDVTIEGDISGDGELHVDGVVRGDVRVTRLTVGETGQVEGSIEAEVVEARGRIIGAISAKQVRLFATSHIDGDITHEQLMMEAGAFFQGRSLKFQRPPPPPAAELVDLSERVTPPPPQSA